MFVSSPSLSRYRKAIRALTNRDETQCVAGMVELLGLGKGQREVISVEAAETVRTIRREAAPGIMEKFLAEYGLNTDEGVALMCLAEAYLRTPDAETLDALISDKIGESDWARHLGRAQSSLVNASTWALMLTGKVFRTIPAQADDLASVMRSLVQRLGEPVARTAVAEAMKVLGAQFVLGRSIEEALANAHEGMKQGYLHSFDMLGEAARTEKDAKRYFLSYSDAISEIAKHAGKAWPHENPGISVKLSALHPRYETVNRERVMRELVPRVTALALHAKAANIPLAIDAEEADRLDLSLDVIEAVLSNSDLAGWDGFGVVVQAYSKRCPAVLDWLHALCGELGRKISVRLVKGAYWDAEIKNAQVLGLQGYPVFTRKEATDVSYLANAKKLLSMTDRIYPQFATHNAHTVVAIEQMAPEGVTFEFQRLHGMGDALHDIRRRADRRPRRIYAPVGVHKDLLAYLVRRLLENGANSSFVNQLMDKAIAPEVIAADPLARLEACDSIPHPAIALPPDIYGERRRNSHGWNLNDPAVLEPLTKAMEPFRRTRWGVAKGKAVTSPVNRRDAVGKVAHATAKEAEAAIAAARKAFPAWANRPLEKRAALLDKTATLYEKHHAEIMAIVVREAGKTRLDAVAEIREAVDFLRYYAAEIRGWESEPKPLGPVVCISPWNFPAAIFTGQIAGALAAGNPVIAKPAEQTPLIAEFLVSLFHKAGVPKGALQLVQGEGGKIGPALTGSPDIAGVAFTGGTDTGNAINQALARRPGPIVPLIAETGGLNAMFVDTTALREQLTDDVILSAFGSAGQRCSALRLLYLPTARADELIEALIGALRTRRLGNPADPATDIGPVIDAQAMATLEAHRERLRRDARIIFEGNREDAPADSSFFAPVLAEIPEPDFLESEVFGPILHVYRYGPDELPEVMRKLAGRGYALTLGIHSRIVAFARQVMAAVPAGNVYINRAMTGAVVGVQPFGGHGLSGTGPKAGGPHSLLRYATERTVTDNIAAQGGDPALLNL